MRRSSKASSAGAYDGAGYGRDASPSAYGSSAGGTCTAVIGSMTQAMKAQSVLAEAAIRSTITKISSSVTHNGCAYGVDFPCPQSANVRMVLARAGVRVREYLQN